MKAVAIVQARTTSTRFPGKVLQDLEGRPMLTRQLERLMRARSIDTIVVATTTNGSDDAVVGIAREAGLAWYRGSEDDVLRRYLEASRENPGDIVVRVTSDCPMLDPDVVDRVVLEMEEKWGACDYASNVIRRTYPQGLDVEAMARDTLERMARLARNPADREHVTRFLLVERPEVFLTRSVEDSESNADLRWTVDEPRDLRLVRRLYQELGLAERDVAYREILNHVRANPELAALNLEAGDPAT